MDLFKSVPHDKLEHLLYLQGVARDFIAFSGDVITTPLENRLQILTALGINPTNEEAVDQLISNCINEPWLEWLEPVSLCVSNEPRVNFFIEIHEKTESFSWQLINEAGEKLGADFSPVDCEALESREIRSRQFSKHQLSLPALVPGYYSLRVSNGEKWVTSQLIISPERCHEPEWLVSGERIWGISSQLYTLSSATNWGMGDFNDLKELIALSVQQGSDYILINPLHALDNRFPEDASPYSPVDRRFLNPLYLHLQSEEEFQSSPAMVEYCEKNAERLKACRGKTSVDYTEVFELKYGAFDLMYQEFKNSHLSKRTARAKQFTDFIEAQDEALQQFAQYQAVRTSLNIESAKEPEFHIYLQWLAEGQLQSCQQLAKDLGMKIGLVRDLAVGSTESSCEVLSNPELFCMDARIGAPPDNFNPDGQNWGLPPIRPAKLKQTRFAHFINLLRSNMRSCGALRIDHVMALMRLWWCPKDGSNATGAYVHYPVDFLFAILRLESMRAGCVVIGEDLGVVPPEIRPFLDDSGLLSNVVFYFEKYDGWHFKRPEHYKQKALAFIANHDTPPLKSWWNGNDIAMRFDIGLIKNEEQKDNEHSYRNEEKGLILTLLKDMNLLSDSWQEKWVDDAYDIELAKAIFHFCAQSASQMLCVQLDDIAGMDSPVNIPGTHEEYENWRRRLPKNLASLFSSQEINLLLQELTATRSQSDHNS